VARAQAHQAAKSSSSCEVRRAGAIGGGRAGKPTPSRSERIETGSVNAATIRMRPPQSGHSETSMSKEHVS
ncbi:MAG: hypothetical protein QGI33_06950, partial [Candidatus Brocadiia bacterium]|nr:hypothetical protein [Candidatus Brocadiia bacterium]